MAAVFSVRHAGVWKAPTAIHVKDAGVWKAPTEAYVKSGGVWQQYWPVAAGELLATYTVSSAFTGGGGPYTGHTGTGAGLRDGLAAAANTVWANNSEPNPFIRADLGSSKAIARIEVMPIPASFGGWGASYLNGNTVSGSTDGSSYTVIATISGAVEGSYKVITVGATYRYIKIGKASGDLGMGEFRIYS